MEYYNAKGSRLVCKYRRHFTVRTHCCCICTSPCTGEKSQIFNWIVSTLEQTIIKDEILIEILNSALESGHLPYFDIPP